MLNIAGCRYMLVTAVAKRARQLLVSKEESSDKKPVAKAVDELYNGELCVRYPAEYYQTSEK